MLAATKCGSVVAFGSSAIDLSWWRRGGLRPTVRPVNTSASPDLGIPRWQRWLLPAVVGMEEAERDEQGGTTVPRSVRDWVVDFVLFGFALIVCFGELW